MHRNRAGAAAVRAGIRLILFICNEDMDNIRIIKSQEN